VQMYTRAATNWPVPHSHTYGFLNDCIPTLYGSLATITTWHSGMVRISGRHLSCLHGRHGVPTKPENVLPG
jgi:hypothetical protein